MQSFTICGIDDNKVIVMEGSNEKSEYNKLKDRAKKAGHDIKQAGEGLVEDAKMVGHEMRANTGHSQEDAKMVGHEIKEAAGDHNADIEKSISTRKKKAAGK
jgi:hypothetical protein